MLFELNRKTIAYQADFQGRQLVVTLKWPRPSTLASLYGSMQTTLTDAGGGRQVISSDEAQKVVPFFRDHFEGLALDGRPVRASRADQLAFITKEAVGLSIPKAIVVEQLFKSEKPKSLSVSPEDDLEDQPDQVLDCQEDQDEAEDHGVDLDALRSLVNSTGRPTQFQFFDEAEGRTVSHTVTHVMKAPNARDMRRYRAILSVLRDVRHGSTLIQRNADDAVALYRDRVIALEGASWDGQPCDQSNHAMWAAAVPYPWIDEVFTQESEGARAADPT